MVAEHKRNVVISVRLEEVSGATQRATKSVTNATQKMEAAAKKAGATATAEAKRTAEESAKAYTRAMQKYTDAQNKVKMGQAQIAERMNTALSDTMRLGRGLAMLGIAGEENTEKLLRGLIKIQAVFDIIGGSVGMFIRMTRVMRDYAEMTKAAAAANTALALAQGTTVVTGTAGAVAGGGGIVRQGGGMMQRLGLGTAAVGGWFGRGMLGRASMRGAGAMAGKLGVGATGAFVLPAFAAAGGVGAAGLSGYQTTRDIRKYGFMGGATPGTYSARMGSRYAALADYASRLGGGDIRGYRAAGRAEERSERLQALLFGGKNKKGEFVPGLEQAMQPKMLMERELRMAQWRMNPLTMAGARGEEAAGRATLAGFQSRGAGDPVTTQAEIGAAYQRVNDAIKEQIRLQGMATSKIMEGHAKTIRASEQKIDLLNRERDAYKKIAEAAEKQGKAALQRFGLMSVAEQAGAARAAQAVKGGTATRQQIGIVLQHAQRESQLAQQAREQAEAFAGGRGGAFQVGFASAAARARAAGDERSRLGAVAEAAMQTQVGAAEREGRRLGEVMNQLRQREFAAIKAAFKDQANATDAAINGLRDEVRQLFHSGRN